MNRHSLHFYPSTSQDTTTDTASSGSADNNALANFFHAPMVSRSLTDGAIDSYDLLREKRQKLLLARRAMNVCNSVEIERYEGLRAEPNSSVSVELEQTSIEIVVPAQSSREISKEEEEDEPITKEEVHQQPHCSSGIGQGPVKPSGPGPTYSPKKENESSETSRKRPFLSRSESTVSVSHVTNVFVKRSLTSFTSFQFTSCDSSSDSVEDLGPAEKPFCGKSREQQPKRPKVEPRVEYFSRRMSSRRKKKKAVQFGGLKVFYFNRAQGFNTVPMVGSVAFGTQSSGMEPTHFTQKDYSLAEFHNVCIKENVIKCENWKKLSMTSDIKAKAMKSEQQSPGCSTARTGDPTETIVSERLTDEPKTDNVDGGQNSPSGSSAGSDSEEESDGEVGAKMDHLLFLHPLQSRLRRGILKGAGVNLDKSAREEHSRITSSRLSCGCSCIEGNCLPASCECALSGIKCQIDKPSFPCPCLEDTQCKNPEGRVVFDPLKVHTHFLQTMMRLKAVERMGGDSTATIISPQHIKFNEEGEAGNSSSYLSVPPPLAYQQDEGKGETRSSVTTQYQPVLTQIDVPSASNCKLPARMDSAIKKRRKAVGTQSPLVGNSCDSEPKEAKPETMDAPIMSSPYFPRCRSLLGGVTTAHTSSSLDAPQLQLLNGLKKRRKEACNQSISEELLVSAMGNGAGNGVNGCEEATIIENLFDVGQDTPPSQ